MPTKPFPRKTAPGKSEAIERMAKVLFSPMQAGTKEPGFFCLGEMGDCLELAEHCFNAAESALAAPQQPNESPLRLALRVIAGNSCDPVTKEYARKVLESNVAPPAAPQSSAEMGEEADSRFFEYMKTLNKPAGEAWTGADIQAAYEAGRESRHLVGPAPAKSEGAR